MDGWKFQLLCHTLLQADVTIYHFIAIENFEILPARPNLCGGPLDEEGSYSTDSFFFFFYLSHKMYVHVVFESFL